MAQALCGPHVQLAFRVRKIERGRGKCEQPREEATEVLEFPGELTVFEIRDIQEVSCGGEEEEVSNDAPGGFDN